MVGLLRKDPNGVVYVSDTQGHGEAFLQKDGRLSFQRQNKLITVEEFLHGEPENVRANWLRRSEGV